LNRNAIIKEIASKISGYKENEVIFVAIDGVDASGKTMFADEISKCPTSRPMIRLSVDHFHHPREKRMTQGEMSPIGYYEDSFNYEFIIREVFEKVRSGIFEIHPKSFDYRIDKRIVEETQKLMIPSNAIILFDGVFLLRHELNEYWDIRIFLDVSFETVVERAMMRDLDYFKDEAILLEKYNNRYIPGQKLYLKKEHPMTKADIVINNNDFNKPIIVKSDL